MNTTNVLQDHSSVRVLIVGGGTAGLLMAQALKKQNIRCSVFEQDASPTARPRDWNFGIYWAQSPLSECLSEELASQIEAAQVDDAKPSKDEYMPLYNAQNAELMKKVPTPMNIRLHRRRLIKLISQGVDITYGKRLSRIESNDAKVTIHFEDGSVETGDLLIGAEGAHSKTREFLLGPEKAALIDSPIVHNATLTKLPKDVALKLRAIHHRYMVLYHPVGQFCWMGVHEAWSHLPPEYWQFMILQSFNADPDHDATKVKDPHILKDMRKRAEDYGEPFKTIVYSIPDDTRCWHNRLSYWLPVPWNNRNGTVTLIGDACHPMTYHRGQGLNNAIEDVATLARHIKAHGIDTPNNKAKAVTAYEAEMIPRGRAAVELSNQNSAMCHDWNQLLQSPIFKMGLSRTAAAEEEKK